jgi:predicted PurR-regulated permease PerM
MLKEKRGVFSFVVAFLMVSILLLALFFAIIPVLINFNTKVSATAEKQFLDANENINALTDNEVKTELYASVNNAYDTIPSQTDILSVIFQYSWVIILAVLAFIWYLNARRTVEYGGLA